MESPLSPQTKQSKASAKIIQDTSMQMPQKMPQQASPMNQQKKIILIAVISTIVALGLVVGGYYGYKHYQNTRPVEIQLQKSSAPVTATPAQRKMQLDQLGALSVPTKVYEKRQIDIVKKERLDAKAQAAAEAKKIQKKATSTKK